MDMDGAEELKMLKELVQAERLAHPTDNDENIIEENSRPVEEPPSLCKLNLELVNFHFPLTLKQILPQVINYLPFPDVLKCRVLCREICQVVDQQLENNLEILPHSTSISKNLPQNSIFIDCRIHSSPTGPNMFEGIHLLDTPTIRAFLQKMRGHEGNPFPGRCVRFGHYDSTHSDYWEHVLDLLRQFGSHIWHVELSDGQHEISDPVACYRLLRHCISHLPNLKSLEISFTVLSEGDEQQVELIRYMNANPMPPLQFLQKLEWKDHNVPQIFQDAIIAEYSKQLKAYSSTSPLSDFCAETNKLTFPNLEVLYLTNVSYNEELSCLLNNGSVLPSLKKLYLNLGGERCTNCSDISDEIWSVKSLLLLVKQFQLEFLSLFLAPCCQLKGPVSLSVEELKLNCLQTLEIHHNNNKETSYEFLRCFPELKHVHFYNIHHPKFPERKLYIEEKSGTQNSNDKINGDEDASALDQLEIQTEEEEEKTITANARTVQIDKFLYTGRMYESNLWEILPRLEMITFKCVWDRQGENIIAVNEWYRRPTYELRKAGRAASLKFFKEILSLV